ncbi:hypothetical protein EGR_10854 [Echinococcus granulosus]|uniref:Uncharacterized protein n=1 Tax=Echinococcus granulosus TaxID=6210 RepID=W6U7E0_ECHGR|nr:hypothetical protein EGR_10854 [Echinococcus granulosus]EUB54287.1 hypothetical protein EGR_10854 [Echinococcus granulosus]
MQFLHFNGILLLVLLLPVHILGHERTVESILDCALNDAPRNIAKYGSGFHVQSVEHIGRSCPFTLLKATISRNVTYTLRTCISASHLVILPPTTEVTELTIGSLELEITVQVTKCVHPGVKVTLEAPVFKDAYLYTKPSQKIPADELKQLILSKAGQEMERWIQEIIYAFMCE